MHTVTVNSLTSYKNRVFPFFKVCDAFLNPLQKISVLLRAHGIRLFKYRLYFLVVLL